MPQKYRVEFTTHARDDLLAIRDYIAIDKPKAAVKWVEATERKIRRLANMPFRHEIIPESAEFGIEYRQLLHGNYRIIYRIADNRVIVIRVIHGAMLMDFRMLE